MRETQDPVSPPPATWADLAKAVRATPGIYISSMGVLRNLEQSRRTDAAQPIIMQALKDRAIGFMPDPLPTRASASVALYMRGTEIGDFVWAVITASSGEPLTPGMAKALTDFGQPRQPDHPAMLQLERLATDLSPIKDLKRLIDDLEDRRGRAKQYLERLKDPRRGH